MSYINETPAEQITGYLLKDKDEKYFFRVYDSIDKKIYKDYKLKAEDIKLQILSNKLSLYESNEENKLDWQSR